MSDIQDKVSPISIGVGVYILLTMFGYSYAEQFAYVMRNPEIEIPILARMAMGPSVFLRLGDAPGIYILASLVCLPLLILGCAKRFRLRASYILLAATVWAGFGIIFT